jgi:CubicO group peptidase (beta-lactamase class C family)
MAMVYGVVDPAFAPVQDALAGVLAEPGELGASVSVVIAGRSVVDVWGGFADLDRRRPWRRDTRCCVFSSGKGPLAMLAHLAAAANHVPLDRPVRGVWPEFAVAGKDRITVRDLLSHRAGLPAVRADLPPGSMFDWAAMTTALAAEEPWWPPGTRHGYHLTTFGWLVGEVVRRICGTSVSDAMRTRLTGPVGSGFTYGARAADVAECSAPQPARPSVADPMDVDPPVSAALMRALTNPPDMLAPDLERSAAWRAAVVPASNGYATARDLTAVYALTSAPGRLPDGVVEDLVGEQVHGPDEVLGEVSRFSSGLMLPGALRPFGRGGRDGHGGRVAGHSGTGGSLAFADLDAGLAFAFVPNRMLTSGVGGDPRWSRLLDAVYGCLGAVPDHAGSAAA